ncbi:MAG TPA: hypothetical protein VGL11_23450 [Candidatus Binatia bacterium]|jgi:hypothetical protein
MKPKWIAAIGVTLMVTAFCSRADAGWLILNWIEKPSAHGPSTQAEAEDRTEFLPLFSFDSNKQDEQSWTEPRQNLREGDLIAYRMDPWEARKKIFLQGKLNVVGYRLLKYGHVAMIVKDPEDETRLRLLSSWSFRGPNTQETLDSLREHSWDAYRMNQWERVDKERFYEFIGVVGQKAGKWYGYDFSGMVGLVNSNLRPGRPEEIGYSYICSTVIVAALQYAGVELDAYQRSGIADIVTPLQLVASKGRMIRPTDAIATQPEASHADASVQPDDGNPELPE